MPFGQHERAVFEEQSTPLYEEIVTSGGISAADARIAERGELHEAFQLLVEVGLVNKSDDGAHWRAVDPAAVQAQVVAPLGQQGAELIAESAHWAQAFSTLSHAWRRSPSAVGGPFAEIRGRDTIGNFLASLVSDAEERAAHRAAAGPSRASSSSAEVGARDDRRAQARRQDAHALPARRATRRRHPQVRRRGDRGRRRGAHPRRVLQPPHRGRPPGRDHPQPRGRATRPW